MWYTDSDVIEWLDESMDNTTANTQPAKEDK
jgi:hypothetical protein